MTLYLRLGIYAALIAIIGTSYWLTYQHGRKVEQGEQAKVQVAELQTAITGMVKDINERTEKDNESQQALQQLDAQMDRFGGQLRRLAGGCVLTPARMQVLNDATSAANATGFAGPVPRAAAAPKR